MKLWRHFISLGSAFSGTTLVLCGMYFMNEYTSSTKQPDKEKDTIAFQVKKPPPPPKQKPKKKKKTKREMNKRSTAPAPNLISPLQGIAFNSSIGNFDFESSTKNLLKDTKKMTMDENSVDIIPKVLSRPNIKYPNNARQKGITGYVIFRLLIDEKGEVKKIKIVESLPGGIFEQEAQNAVRDTKYQPAIYDGHPVKIWVKTKIRFELS